MINRKQKKTYCGIALGGESNGGEYFDMTKRTTTLWTQPDIWCAPCALCKRTTKSSAIRFLTTHNRLFEVREK